MIFYIENHPIPMFLYNQKFFICNLFTVAQILFTVNQNLTTN